MPNVSNDLDNWSIIHNFVQSTFATETLSSSDRECCRRIICWYEKNFSDVEDIIIAYKINVVMHRIYVALGKFSKAGQVLLSLPYISSDDLTPLIPRNIPIPNEIVTNYIEFLLDNDLSPTNAKSLLLIRNDLAGLFNYMENCLFSLSNLHTFNYQYFSEQMDFFLDDNNEFPTRLLTEFTNFFKRVYDKRQTSKYHQDFALDLDYIKLSELSDAAEDLSKLSSKDVLALKVGNWFEFQKSSITQILINYPQLITCIFSLQYFTYTYMILDLFNDTKHFHLILKPFADYLSANIIKGFDGSSIRYKRGYTRVYFPRFYICLFEYLNKLLENYDHLAKVSIDIIEPLTQICCELYDSSTLPYSPWGRQGDLHIDPLARANFANVMMVIQLLLLTQNYEQLNTLIPVAKKAISKTSQGKKIVELCEGSIINESGSPSLRYLNSILNCFSNPPQTFLSFGIKYAQLFHINFLSNSLLYSSSEYAKVLKIASLFTLNYGLPSEYISQFIRTIPSNLWQEIYNELLTEFHANKNSIVSFFSSSQKVKENAKVDSLLARILIEVTSLPELDAQLRRQIANDFPNCVVGMSYVLVELNSTIQNQY